MHSQPLSEHHRRLLAERIITLRESLCAVLQDRSHVTLEIGSGHGHFLTAYAALHPERFFLGIDIMSDRLERSERKRARAGLNNLSFVRASAEDLLLALPAGVLLDDIFLLFPDPWPKRRHHKNRIMQTGFLGSLATKSTPGAHLYFRTDFADYFTAARSTLLSHDRWREEPTHPWPYEMPTVFQSRATAYESLIAIRT